MSKNLPSKRYDLFVKAFEKMVTEAQKSIERARAMELPYNAVKEALEAVNLPHDTKLAFGSSSVSVKVTALPEDRLETFESLVKAIGKRLFEAGAHRDGEPASERGGWWHQIQYTWNMRRGDIYSGYVMLTVELPSDGISDIAVQVRKEVYEGRTYLLHPRNPATWAPPANMRTVAEEIVF
ncbi:MAG: hypothetical protein K2X43_01125 [Hyphomonadaceae bacterium]|jgi:hypothetical protein|nr:hypothetical protein [Hyphomonadaceae bacterium]